MGIFIWVDMPENDTSKLYDVAIKQGVAINPGHEWSVNPGKHKMRLVMETCYSRN